MIKWKEGIIKQNNVGAMQKRYNKRRMNKEEFEFEKSSNSVLFRYRFECNRLSPCTSSDKKTTDKLEF